MHVRKSLKLKIILLVTILVAQSCATYYQTNLSFNLAFQNGNLEEAYKELQSAPSKDYRKKEFLYLTNSGLLLSILGRYEESNEFFEKAFLFGEDYQRNYFNEAASFLTNPNFTSYKGEDHEHLLLLYYKAINFLKMDKHEEALVECRRLNIRLQQLSDRYKSDTKYKEDAFIHLLMGIIYESDKDYNNAFIAYRNAYNIYIDEYSELFGTPPPPQLKEDIVKTALLSGLTSEYEEYKQEFGMEDYEYMPSAGGDLIFFWHNGLSPIKTEWSINFVVDRKENSVVFYNEKLGMSFPFNIGSYDDEEKDGLSRLEVFRVAFPKYVERPVYYEKATLNLDSSDITLQKAEDVNKIAFKVLDERMALEFSKALIRAAIKKAAEYQVRKDNKQLGSLLGILNAFTEKADTRNWQTLPHTISYCRVPLKLGTNTVKLNLEKQDGATDTHEFTYVIDKKGTIFHTFTSLESGYPSYTYN